MGGENEAPECTSSRFQPPLLARIASSKEEESEDVADREEDKDHNGDHDGHQAHHGQKL